MVDQCNTYWGVDNRYNEECDKKGYNGPRIAAEILGTLIQNKDADIIDICAGNGRVGKELHALEFNNIDALDGSSVMFEEARALKLYQNYFCELIDEEQETTLTENKYDAAVCVSAVTDDKGLDPATLLNETWRTLKTGGYAVFAIQHEYINRESGSKFMPHLHHMLAEGKWQILRSDIYPKHYGDAKGQMVVLMKQ